MSGYSSKERPCKYCTKQKTCEMTSHICAHPQYRNFKPTKDFEREAREFIQELEKDKVISRFRQALKTIAYNNCENCKLGCLDEDYENCLNLHMKLAKEALGED